MKRKQSLLFTVILYCLAGTFRAEATAYTVKAGGGGSYTTIQSCANVAVAGDTCLVFGGTYSEYVTPAHSGSVGSFITFQANSGDPVSVKGFNLSSLSYVAVSGFQIIGPTTGYNSPIQLSASSHVTIQNNSIMGGPDACINNKYGLAYNSSYITVLGNTISWCGAPPITPAGGIGISGDHWLVDGNTISHVSDFIYAYGTYAVIRNNTWGPVSVSDFPGTADQLHIDGIENSCSSGTLPLLFSLIENNVEINNTVPNGHFGIWHAGTCTESNSIIRENALLNIGAYFVLSDLGGFQNVKVYNNSVAGVVNKDYHLSAFLNNSTGGASINNIYYDSLKNGGYINALDNSTSPTFVGSHDLAYNPSCGLSCTWQAPITTETGVILNRDPLFVNPTSNLHLRSRSPARRAGTHLTTVASSDSGSGTTLTVNDAGFFQDGSGIVGADWIRVGTTNTVQISSINYATKTIMLVSSISRSANDPVYLYQDSNGKVVLLGRTPDIGAYQYGPAPEPPANLTAIPR
jgi:hypothetical protein